MIIIRSLLFYALCTITVLIFAPFVLLFRLISLRAARSIPDQWTMLATFLAKWICGVEWRVSRETPLSEWENRSYIYLAKHQSTWETFFLYWFLPNTTWVAKKELSYIPFFGWAMNAAALIMIDRKKGKRAFDQVYDQAKMRTALGESILLFPEGTRQKDLTKKTTYKTGGARLAKKLDIPVVPIAHNAGHRWPAKSMWLKPGVVDVVVGAPIYPEQKSADEIMNAVENFIEGHVRKPER